MTYESERWAAGRKLEICPEFAHMMGAAGRRQHERQPTEAYCTNCRRNLCGCSTWSDQHTCALRPVIIAEREAETAATGAPYA